MLTLAIWLCSILLCFLLFRGFQTKLVRKCTSVVQLTWISHFGERFYGIAMYTLPGMYLVVLLVWIVGLWSYQPTPVPV